MMVAGVEDQQVDVRDVRHQRGGNNRSGDAQPRDSDNNDQDTASVTMSSHSDDTDDEDKYKNCPDVITEALQMSSGMVPTTISMENSSDVQIGTRLNYNAPVTINQVVHVSGNETLVKDNVLDGPVPLPRLEYVISRAEKALPYARPPSTDVSTKPSFRCSRESALWLLGGAGGATAVVLVVWLLSQTSREYMGMGATGSQYPEFNPDDITDPNTTLPSGGRIYSKSEWSGAVAESTIPLKHPTPYVVVSHTAGSSCFDQVRCAYLVRNIQDEHMGDSLRLPDIGYSFLIGGDGSVFSGRGWDSTNMHTGFVRRCNIGISLLGNFVKEIPTSKQITSLQELIELGVKLGKLAEDYRLMGHKQTYPTQSPGFRVMNIIMKWEHFYIPTANATADPV